MSPRASARGTLILAADTYGWTVGGNASVMTFTKRAGRHQMHLEVCLTGRGRVYLTTLRASNQPLPRRPFMPSLGWALRQLREAHS